MIAAQTDELIASSQLLSDQKIEDPSCVRPAINIVAHEYEPRMPIGLDRFAGLHQADQLVKAAMNVTDCKCDDIVQRASPRSSWRLGKETIFDAREIFFKNIP